MATPKKHTLLHHYQALIAGLDVPELLPDDFAIGVRGQRLDKVGLAKALSTKSQPLLDYQAAEVALERARQAAERATADAKAYAEQVDVALKAYLTPRHPKLPKLDIKPKAMPKPLTTEQTLMRTLKSNATRKARGTLGPRQKLSIRSLTVPTTKIVIDDSGLHIAEPEGSPPSGASPPEPASHANPGEVTPSS
jgi:hypothetical protein